MKLYIYEHCPFCVRARMIFGLRDVAWKRLSWQTMTKLTPIGMIGSNKCRFCKKKTVRLWVKVWYCPLHRLGVV